MRLGIGSETLEAHHLPSDSMSVQNLRRVRSENLPLILQQPLENTLGLQRFAAPRLPTTKRWQDIEVLLWKSLVR